jgi:hypothetical protein
MIFKKGRQEGCKEPLGIKYRESTFGGLSWLKTLVFEDPWQIIGQHELPPLPGLHVGKE